jgi:hypothetical protein
METKKQYRQRLLKQHENDLVFMIYHFRDKMRKIQDVINRDLVKMTGEFPIFVSHAADELEKLARQQRELELALSVHELREFGYTKRVLERVVQWEKHSDSEKNDSK